MIYARSPKGHGGTSSVGAFLTGALDFEIKGEKGSQRITFDVVEAGINSSIQVGSEFPDCFVIKFCISIVTSFAFFNSSFEEIRNTN